MSWAQNMLPASFGGVGFDVFSTSDSRDYKQAHYQTPYSDHATLEYMGADPNNIHIEGLISGDQYELQAQALLSALVLGKGELVHPVFGVMQVSVVNHDIRHDPDFVDACRVTLSFKRAEDPATQPGFTAVKQSIPSTLASKTLAFPTLRLQQLLDQIPFYSQISQTASQLSNMMSNGASAVRQQLGIITTDIDDFTSPPDWISSLLADVTGLADGVVPGSGGLAAWRALFGAVGNISTVFNTAASGQTVQAPIPEPLLQVSRNLVVASSIGIAQAMLAGEVDNPTFTPPELEQIRGDIRGLIQSTISTERQVQAQQLQLPINANAPAIPSQTVQHIAALKDAADVFQTQVQQLIERRPPFVPKSVPVLTCPRWLAFKWYGDHTRAPEIVRLNPQVANPAQMYAGMTVNAYAQ